MHGSLMVRPGLIFGSLSACSLFSASFQLVLCLFTASLSVHGFSICSRLAPGPLTAAFSSVITPGPCEVDWPAGWLLGRGRCRQG